jgi:hypothetical protein
MIRFVFWLLVARFVEWLLEPKWKTERFRLGTLPANVRVTPNNIASGAVTSYQISAPITTFPAHSVWGVNATPTGWDRKMPPIKTPWWRRFSGRK